MAVAYKHCVKGNRDGCAKYKPARHIVKYEIGKAARDAELLRPSLRNNFEQLKLKMLSVLARLDAMHTSCSAATSLSSCASSSKFDNAVDECQQLGRMLNEIQPELASRQSAGQSLGVEFTTLAQVMFIHVFMHMSAHVCAND